MVELPALNRVPVFKAETLGLGDGQMVDDRVAEDIDGGVVPEPVQAHDVFL